MSTVQTPTFEMVQQLIADALRVDKEKVTPEASIVDDLKADSLDVVELIMALEDGCDMEVPDEDAKELRTVSDVMAYINRRLAIGKIDISFGS